MPNTSTTTKPLLQVQNLSVEFPGRRLVKAVENVDLEIRPGEVVGLAGETGCGKTVFVTSILGLIRKPGRVSGGAILWRGRDLLRLSAREVRKVRGAEISMIFQNPLPSLNPARTIGAQLRNLLIYHKICSAHDANDHAMALLNKVQLRSPERVIKLYPFECSGGMCQRILIAMALAGKPKLLIADEPTTSLDVTVQAQIIRLILELKRETGMAVLFVSHDLGVMASICDRVAVMYRGKLVESANSTDLFKEPSHPYTRMLLDSSLIFSGREHAQDFQIPVLEDTAVEFDNAPGCRFYSTCPERLSECWDTDPVLRPVQSPRTHLVACIRRGQSEAAGVIPEPEDVH